MQANFVAIPKEFAFDFTLFCLRNPRVSSLEILQDFLYTISQDFCTNFLYICLQDFLYDFFKVGVRRTSSRFDRSMCRLYPLLSWKPIKNNYFTKLCSGSEKGSYLRLIDFSRLESNKKKREVVAPPSRVPDMPE